MKKSDVRKGIKIRITRGVNVQEEKLDGWN